MAQYQFALNQNSNIIKAFDLVDKPTNEKFACLGCGKELIAKVKGEIKSPHFAHKNLAECNGETYLHHLGKLTFYNKYKSCLESNTPFIIELTHQKVCDKFSEITNKSCKVGKTRKEYDLTQYYSKIEIEKKDDEFIPDILLSSDSRLDDKIYIEIAVTHFLSKEKRLSNNRVIEITLESENDLKNINKAHLGQHHALFIGFDGGKSAISDHECQCNNKMHHAFFVYSSGKSFFETDTINALHKKFIQIKNSLIWMKIIDDRDLVDDIGDVYLEFVKDAYNKNVDIKNCHLCHYHVERWKKFGRGSIHCKLKDSYFNPNIANECKEYRPL